jgi:hypothetical protein
VKSFTLCENPQLDHYSLLIPATRGNLKLPLLAILNYKEAVNAGGTTAGGRISHTQIIENLFLSEKRSF